MMVVVGGWVVGWVGVSGGSVAVGMVEIGSELVWLWPCLRGHSLCTDGYTRTHTSAITLRNKIKQPSMAFFVSEFYLVDRTDTADRKIYRENYVAALPLRSIACSSLLGK